jgi:serine/threonine-protein kinase
LSGCDPPRILALVGEDWGETTIDDPVSEDAPADDVAYAPGTVLGSKYRLERQLGRGGMGTVWLARNIRLDSDVAIKLIRRHVASELAHKRLLREARAAARLGHPSIVRVHDFGETEHGDPFIVLEMLDGESLGALLDRQRRIAAIEAVQLLLPIASALEAAHKKGIIHRDLKPDNIILTIQESGEPVPKLVDFGIARFGEEHIHAEGASDDSVAAVAQRVAARLTQAGTLVGSPQYMSPEQARGAFDIDGRIDVWGLSVVLYEAVAGRRPFDAPDYRQLICDILTEEPPPIDAAVVGDRDLWPIVARGLARDREKRWPSPGTMGEALARWLLDRGVDSDISGRSLRKHWLGEQVSLTGLRPAPSLPSGVALPASGARPSSPTLDSTPPRPIRRRIEGLAALVAVAAAAASALVIVAREQPPAPQRATIGLAARPAIDGDALLEGERPAAPVAASVAASLDAPDETPPAAPAAKRAPPAPHPATAPRAPTPASKPSARNASEGVSMPIPNESDF